MCYCNRCKLGAVVVLVTTMFATGCSTTRGLPPIAPKPELAKVTLAAPNVLPNLDVGLTGPTVNLGDVFVYDNPPLQWTVTSIDGPFIGWTNNSGGVLQTAWSTLLPALRWSGGDNAVDTGQRRISQLTGKLFPLKKGNRVTFFEETIYARPGAAVNGYWRCDVGEQSEIVVPAGKTQAWEVLCLLNGHEKRVLYYSEKIGHVVRTAITTENGLAMRQLTGYARARTAALSAESTGTPATTGNRQPAIGEKK